MGTKCASRSPSEALVRQGKYPPRATAPPLGGEARYEDRSTQKGARLPSLPQGLMFWSGLGSGPMYFFP